MDPSVATSTLLITPFNSALVANGSCLAGNFYGYYGAGMMSIFRPDVPCLDSWASTTLASASIVPVWKESQLVWVEEVAVDAKLKSETWSFQSDLDALFERLSQPFSGRDVEGQEIFTLSGVEPDYELLYQSHSSALLSVSPEKARVIDTIIPAFWKSTLLPQTPVSFQPVPPTAVEHISRLLSTLKFDPVVASIVNNISVLQMENDVRFLTGEDGLSGIVSRHSFAEGSRTAAAWLKDRFEDTGAACELQPFLSGFAPNVICRYPSITNTTATVLLSAHYDSRGSFGSTRAPGGDDDGSGTTALLAIARTIARKGVKFHSNVELVAFAGEEQGLYGSRAYAGLLRQLDANLTLMIQADMLAYHAPGEPLQLGLPDRIGTPEVSQLVANISAIYSPELTVGFTPACCSDHQSFHEQGFPATQVFERVGPIIDPMYHNSGDLSEREGYDLEQVKLIAKVQFATLLHTAGFDLSK